MKAIFLILVAVACADFNLRVRDYPLTPKDKQINVNDLKEALGFNMMNLPTSDALPRGSFVDCKFGKANYNPLRRDTR